MDKAELKHILQEIARDMHHDAENFDGKPFNGRTVAEYFGNQGAAIAGLARIVEALVDEVAETPEGGPR